MDTRHSGRSILVAGQRARARSFFGAHFEASVHTSLGIVELARSGDR